MNIWTVPERKDYGAESLERVRRAIMTVNSEIRQELVSKEPRPRIHPKQSSVNLNRFVIISPTISVSSSVLSGKFSIGSIRELAGRMSASTLKHSNSRTGRREDGLATLECSSSSRSSSRSTIRPVKEKSSISTRKLARGQDMASNGTPAASSPVRTASKELATAQTNSGHPDTANRRTSETRRQSPQGTAGADTAGVDSAMQLPMEPATQDGREKGHDGRLLSPWPGRNSHRIERQRVSPGSPAYVRLKKPKLNMHVYLEEGLTENSGCTKASISLVPVEQCGSEADSAVDLRSMAAGDELVVGKRDGADSGELSIRVQLGDGEDTMLLCSWDGSEIQGSG
ncbi:hypothetical protein BK809_0005265 [Diplodia seriata]|uniref:Uncharacterized protein n=1 Tax=Diplodia seriata TaxID=420778 RepID=A0A1S8BM23_9PEZI|nr:hypothetical protein BK809_0005265 [Diplodia seriata]